jgi:hypothetical protein
MPDEDDEAIREQIAFEARFPLEAFKPIACALGRSAEPQSLKALQGWLLPYFDLYVCGTGTGPSRAERRKSLEELRGAATTLIASVGVRGLWLELPWDLVEATADGQFKATVQRLAEEADAQIQHLSRLGRTGRPAKNAAFREMTPELVRIYEHIARREAGKPYWLPDSRTYGGEFYRFAVAVCGCLRDCLPDVPNALPTTDGALAQELQDHWPKEDAATG